MPTPSTWCSAIPGGAGDGILTAHNAAFDTGFIERKAWN